MIITSGVILYFNNLSAPASAAITSEFFASSMTLLSNGLLPTTSALKLNRQFPPGSQGGVLLRPPKFQLLLVLPLRRQPSS